jgi:DNA-binding transcriptional MerR regulator
MANVHLISFNEMSSLYNIELSFFFNLEEIGLIQPIVQADNQKYIPGKDLQKIEKFIRWYADLNINPEGIQAIDYLLKRMKSLKKQVQFLQTKLALYE